jgi:hypothetical protein
VRGNILVEEVFAEYLKALRKTPVPDKTEHTDRPAMQVLLDVFASCAGHDINVQHEPKRVAEKGAPDFKVMKPGTILGYVETKAIGENLAKVFKSNQLRRYRELSSNIVLTDYLEWIWIRNGQIQQAETLCHETDRRFPTHSVSRDGQQFRSVVRAWLGIDSGTPSSQSDRLQARDLSRQG